MKCHATINKQNRVTGTNYTILRSPRTEILSCCEKYFLVLSRKEEEEVSRTVTVVNVKVTSNDFRPVGGRLVCSHVCKYII